MSTPTAQQAHFVEKASNPHKLPPSLSEEMSIRQNILTNYVGTAAVVLAPLVALPWYLACLGPSQFGLVGFISVLQAVLSLLDAGLSQGLVREFALRSTSTAEAKRSSAYLLFGFERIYWTFALAAAIATILSADMIATKWLNLGNLPATAGHQAIYGAAAIFAVQFPGSIYRSYLVGVQAQLQLNVIQTTAVLLRHAGGVAVVIVFPTLIAYLVWHVLIGLIETIVRAKYAWSATDSDRRQFRWINREIRADVTTAASMSGAILLGSLTVQMDRLVLSRMVPITDFAYYTLAAAVAVGSLQIINPLTQAILPRAIALRNEPQALWYLYIKLSIIIVGIVATGALCFITIGDKVLMIWLHDDNAVSIVYPILSISLIGTALNAFYNIGYMHWLVSGNTKKVLYVNLFSLIASGLFLPFMISSHGLIGAAFGWVLINFIGFLASLGWIKKGHKS